MLINGVPGNLINAEDRGLSYGDGVFRTLRIRDGQPLHWQRHFAKLHHDCEALRIPCPSAVILFSELHKLAQTQPDGVAKITITRGVAKRGYAPSAQCEATRIVSLDQSSASPDSFYSQGVRLHICRLRLSHQPLLAGIKHLNRLENVLAASEWRGEDVPEGIVSDIHEHIIGGTRSNIFMVRGNILYTPNLSRCGVAGMQRDRVIDWAKQHGAACNIVEIKMEELQSADEVFLVNSVFGLWPVCEVGNFRRTQHPIAWKIQEWLNHEDQE